MRFLLLNTIVAILIVSCQFDDSAELPSVEEREEEAINELNNLLQAPANGWRVDYRPFTGSGSFFILMNFNADGTVRIRGDVAANSGQFEDQTIPYRIDNAQGLELVLETYAVFHYLFELERATFGGEFEFIFVEEQGDNLVFQSKTDAEISNDITRLSFEPADASDSDLLSLASFSQLGQGIFQTEDLAGVGRFATYNIYFEGNDHTLSTTIDLNRRIINFQGIAQGQTIDQIVVNNVGSSINQEIPFGIRSGVIVLDQPITTSLGGVNYNITELPLENFNQFTENFCVGQQETIASFNSDAVTGLGDITVSSSLFQTHSNFQAGPDVFFTVNYIFLYDENDSTIREDIEAVFPEVVEFQWYYGVELARDSLLNALGFVTVNEQNNAEFYLRGFDFVQNGNRIQMTPNGEDFITNENPTPEELTGLEQLTDQIFSGGEVFILEVPGSDGLFEFYNPCNKYKGFIVER